jgi:hypothetical protein
MSTLSKRCCAAVAFLALLAVPVGAQETPRAASLEQKLLQAVPNLIGYLQGKGFKNVGVLKFQVQKDGVLSDNVGPLNLAIAKRLEVALALANDNDEQTQIGLIKDANTVAATIKGASHLTAEGRQKLFSKRYPLAWGNEEVEPDAFLTGIAVLDPGLETMKLHVIVFGKDEASRKTVQHLDVAVDPSLLVESGSSFLLRGGADDGGLSLVPEKGKAIPKAVKDAVAAVQKDAQKALTPDEQTPVKLSIFYSAPAPPPADDLSAGRRSSGAGSKDNKTKFTPVPLEFKDGRALVPEPAEGQGIVLRLERDKSDRRYGVVVRVNGENTLFGERLAPVDCTKWVLEKGQQAFTIRGIRTETELRRFTVSSIEESKANEVNYGPDVGTISLVVFRESAGGVAPPDLPEDEQTLQRAVLPEERPRDAVALKKALREAAVAKKAPPERRGVGEPEKNGVAAPPLERVDFIPDPVPVQSVTITYYRPQTAK